MNDKKLFPKIGDKLIHKFRKRPGSVTAEVISIDMERGDVSVKIGRDVFPSLSSAAQSIAGHSSNGWTYWGLKKQKPKRRAER